MQPFTLTSAMLAAIAGALLSLGFSYIPGLNAKFAEMSAEAKRLVMSGLLLLSSLAIFGLGCAGILQSGITCDQQGAVQLVWIFLSAVMANQSVYQLTPQTKTVKQIKSDLNKQEPNP